MNRQAISGAAGGCPPCPRTSHPYPHSLLMPCGYMPFCLPRCLPVPHALTPPVSSCPMPSCTPWPHTCPEPHGYCRPGTRRDPVLTCQPHWPHSACPHTRLPINSSVQRAGLGTLRLGPPQLLPGPTPERPQGPGLDPSGVALPPRRGCAGYLYSQVSSLYSTLRNASQEKSQAQADSKAAVVQSGIPRSCTARDGKGCSRWNRCLLACAGNSFSTRDGGSRIPTCGHPGFSCTGSGEVMRGQQGSVRRALVWLRCIARALSVARARHRTGDTEQIPKHSWRQPRVHGPRAPRHQH